MGLHKTDYNNFLKLQSVSYHEFDPEECFKQVTTQIKHSLISVIYKYRKNLRDFLPGAPYSSRSGGGQCGLR